MRKSSPTSGPVLPRAARREWRRRILLSSGGLLLFDVVFFALAFRPGGWSFGRQREQVDSLRAELKARRESVARLQRIEASLAEADKQGLDFFNRQFLPKVTGYSTVMEEVDKLATASGVRKGAVNYGLAQLKDRTDLEAVEIVTALEGEYTKIVQFINRLEQSPLFLTVDSMTVGTGQGRVIKLGVRLITYFRVAL